jgi:CyaY protein
LGPWVTFLVYCNDPESLPGVWCSRQEAVPKDVGFAVLVEYHSRWGIMTEPLTEQVFRMKVDEAIEGLQRSLFDWADAEGFEVDMQGSVLNIVFEEPTQTRFVVSPNAPVRQIWISALVKSYKLGWSDDLGAFALEGESLAALVTRLIHQHLGH